MHGMSMFWGCAVGTGELTPPNCEAMAFQGVGFGFHRSGTSDVIKGSSVRIGGD
jgi:hypothetical protein